MVTLQFDVAGEAQVRRTLSRVTDRIENLEPFYDDFGKYLKEAIENQFDTQGGRSRRWEPLSPRYAAQKLRRYGSRPILVASGFMRDEVLSAPIRNRNAPSGVELFVEVPDYALYHQTGATLHHGGRLPQRRIVDLTEDDARAAVKMLQRHLFANQGRL